MRLIDADALPFCWQPDTNGNRRYVDSEDLDAAPTVECAACEHWDEFFPSPVGNPYVWGKCAELDLVQGQVPKGFGCSHFQRRQQ